jgi:ABC-2 type transport system permease protein
VLRRELAIVFRSRVTWLAAALAAVLIGHGFVLAVDLYSASSRSALASLLQAREMEPLAGIVRPTLGGFDLAVALLGPLVAARGFSAEKERRTYGALCLEAGSIARVVAIKIVGAILATLLLLVPVLVALVTFVAVGGHLDTIEVLTGLGGAVLHAGFVVGASLAAAAWTSTMAQAVAIGIIVSVASWAIDASEGFAALAWLGGAESWSVERQLAPFQKGIFAIGPLGWLLGAIGCGVALAFIGSRFDWSPLRKAAASAGTVAAACFVMAFLVRHRRGYDWTEQQRQSFPPAAVEAIRRISEPIRVEVLLDRDDSRRRQLESDFISKLLLARPDAAIQMPLDAASDRAEMARDQDYGRIILQVGQATRETRSTSRRELATLLFEAAGQNLPDWTSPPYAGYPVVIDGSRRVLLGALSYLVLPFGLTIVGLLVAPRRKRP